MSTSFPAAFASATELLRAMRSREVSARELLDFYLARIARFNPTLNAIIALDEEGARAAAGQADDARGRGKDAPLLGLPMTIKDAFDVQGLPGVAGLPQFAQHYAVADSPAVARLRAAGAVIIGKTNVPVALADYQTTNPIYGRTNNPWDVSRTPGGSTGGGAAALAAGLTALELGNDFGGSIRVPAAFCGVYGHRSSETALPRYGNFPHPPLPNPAEVFTVSGPLARAAVDLELAFDAVAGPAIGEDAAWRLKVPAARHLRLTDYRAAVLPSIPGLLVDDEIVAARDRLAQGLVRLGIRVAEAQPDALGDLRAFVGLAMSLSSITRARSLTAEQRREQAAALRATDPEFGEARARGFEATAWDYLGWLNQREQVRASFRAFFRDWDVLLLPSTITPAFPHSDVPISQRFLEIDGQQVPADRLQMFPRIATLPGQPSTTFPVGRSRAGLPIGLEVIGPYLEDRTPIRFAALVAEEFGGFEPPPDYH